MCVVIIPLAGPDFYTEKFGIRPLYKIGESTLIEYILRKRGWMLDKRVKKYQLIFVLRREGLHTEKMLRFIEEKFPTANTVTLSHLTSGAPFSALAGISASIDKNIPVVVDLADIAFDMNFDPHMYFNQHPEVDAIVPYFESRDPKFSYLKLDGHRVVEAVEKKVVSSHASAGVYFFRNSVAYLNAVIYCMTFPDLCRVGSSFFVCPTVNGLISQTKQVHAIEVKNVEPISEIFH